MAALVVTPIQQNSIPHQETYYTQTTAPTQPAPPPPYGDTTTARPTTQARVVIPTTVPPTETVTITQPTLCSFTSSSN